MFDVVIVSVVTVVDWESRIKLVAVESSLQKAQNISLKSRLVGW